MDGRGAKANVEDVLVRADEDSDDSRFCKTMDMATRAKVAQRPTGRTKAMQKGCERVRFPLGKIAVERNVLGARWIAIAMTFFMKF